MKYKCFDCGKEFEDLIDSGLHSWHTGHKGEEIL
jgi:DNA-directed RNA polymerase subunit RPC12/RpoP